MKILLTAVNARYIHSNPAVYSLKAYAEEEIEEGLEIEIAEYTINHRIEYILSDLYRRKPDVAAFSCYIWNWRIVEEVILELSRLMPELPLWLGGPEVSFDAEERLKQYPMVTGIITGEGEETFRELAEYYKNDSGRDGLSGIRGIVYRSGTDIVRTDTRELLEMDRLPFLYQQADMFQNRIVYYESSRGCPFRCSYCLSSVDKTVRFRSLEKTQQELKVFLEQRVAQVKFVDRTFNCSKKHALGIWKYLLEHDNGITNFHFEVDAELLEEEELELLSQMRPGLVQLEIGVQTTNPKVLQEICRSTEIRKLETVMKRLREKRNIHVHLDLIAGLPYEDYESFRTSFSRVYQMRPDQLQLGFLKVLKGTSIERAVREYGICHTSRPPYEVLYTDWISYEELCRLKQVEEMVELYYNSGQFVHTLSFLECAFDSPFSMFEALALYYEEKGYAVQQPSRSYRYQVLLDFAAAKDPQHQELYQELLTYDLYLRENMKSRPGFAGDISPWKEKIRSCYRDRELQELMEGYRELSAAQIARRTHAEVFHYPLWEMSSAPVSRRLKREVIGIFDYQYRDPVSHEARVYWVST